ncbi:MAG TPA: DUF2339 domain-containing protein [Pyrinomonadaceae bacterium]|nr:DUF2339 domain-containing protein [Pyrinomonadaceae bacterium]
MAEDLSSREILEQLAERLDHLERVLQANTARLHAIEQRLSVEPPQPARPRPAIRERYQDEISETDLALHTTETANVTAGEERSQQQDATRRAASSAAYAGAASGPSPGAASEGEAARKTAQAGAGGARAVKRRDLESLIGGSWFNWIGIIAVTFGVAFFLKLAFDNQWVGAGARVALGAAAGLALLFVGERLRRRGLRQYAYVLSGGGILILYLSIYAAYNFYRLVAQPFAFLLMVLVTATAVLLSVRLNALPVAVLGLVGGFLTPALLSTGADNEVALFAYVSLLDAGVLAVAYFKRWRSLDFLSFAGTLLMTLAWAVSFYDRQKLWTTLAFLTLFFVLYSLLAVFHNVLPRRRSRWFDVALASANAAFYFSLSYLLLTDAGYEHATPASLSLLVSAFFALLFHTVWRLSREDRLLKYSYIGAGVTFFTIAAAIQLDLQWVTMAWAIEGLMLTWVGLRSGESAPRHAALAVYGVAVLHWLLWDAPEFAYAGGSFVPLLNPRALSCAVLVGALAGGGHLYSRGGAGPGERGPGERERSAAATLCALAANGLALVLLTLDLGDFFDRQRTLAGNQASDFTLGRIRNARQFSLSALWTIYGITLLAYGVRRGFKALRYAGLTLLVAATIKVLTVDLTFYAAPWHVPVINQTFMAFALLVIAYALAARLYARGAGAVEEERAFVPALVVVANVLAVVALSAEAAGYFDAGRGPLADAMRLRDLELAKQLSLSVVWALYGAGLLVAGRVWRLRLLRLMSLALLSLTTLKVFFRDLSSLDRVYRIISFIVLGAILLAVSYLYQRSQQRAAAEAEPPPTPPHTTDTTEAAR